MGLEGTFPFTLCFSSCSALCLQEQRTATCQRKVGLHSYPVCTDPVHNFPDLKGMTIQQHRWSSISFHLLSSSSRSVLPLPDNSSQGLTGMVQCEFVARFPGWIFREEFCGRWISCWWVFFFFWGPLLLVRIAAKKWCEEVGPKISAS